MITRVPVWLMIGVAAALLIVPWRYVDQDRHMRREIKAGYSLLFVAPWTQNYNTELDYPRYGVQLLATAVIAALILLQLRQKKD
jgi:capsule polysaccharide modification protein KpsS